MRYRLGRLAPHPRSTHPRLLLGDYIQGSLPAPDASEDWYTAVDTWPMYLNDEIGDCTEAMVGHLVESAAAYGQGSAVQVTDADVLAAYERVSGYDPADPATDIGAVLQDVYGDWRRNGVGGHHVTVYAQVDHTDHTQLKQSVGLFGAAGLGIIVTQDMMDAFHAGQAWTHATGEILGGHAVPVVGYDNLHLFVISWGKVQAMSWSCYDAATDEAWAALLPEWCRPGAASPSGLDLAALGADFHALTGEPDPFAAPSVPAQATSAEQQATRPVNGR